MFNSSIIIVVMIGKTGAGQQCPLKACRSLDDQAQAARIGQRTTKLIHRQPRRHNLRTRQADCSSWTTIFIGSASTWALRWTRYCKQEEQLEPLVHAIPSLCPAHHMSVSLAANAMSSRHHDVFRCNVVHRDVPLKTCKPAVHRVYDKAWLAGYNVTCGTD